MREGIELIQHLCACFGPSSMEREVTDAIRAELAELPVELRLDRMGNLVAHLKGAEGTPRVMLCAHTDEVGFMITDIDEDGFLRFDNVGGIDRRVLCGRHVLIGDETRRVRGVIAAKGIHMQSAEERKRVPEQDALYIDIGARDRAEAEEVVSLGDLGVFDTPVVTFGKDNGYVRGKALDDRMGCALLIEVLRAVADKQLPLDLYFCFTVREEIGRSGATVTANQICPDYAVILETTAIADLPETPAAKRVAQVGAGGVLSLMDRATIYDRAMVDRALALAEKNKIPVQVKKYVSGGNDAQHIQKCGTGTRCLALSAATRYLHAPVSVAALCDYVAMRDLVVAMLEDWKED